MPSRKSIVVASQYRGITEDSNENWWSGFLLAMQNRIRFGNGTGEDHQTLRTRIVKPMNELRPLNDPEWKKADLLVCWNELRTKLSNISVICMAKENNEQLVVSLRENGALLQRIVRDTILDVIGGCQSSRCFSCLHRHEPNEYLTFCSSENDIVLRSTLDIETVFSMLTIPIEWKTPSVVCSAIAKFPHGILTLNISIP